MLIINIDSDVIILIVVLDVINLFVIGYKAFNKDFTNRYGDKFKIGKIYHADGEIKWGNNGNGFHLCKHIEDCFRYVNPNDSIMTEVIGFGDVKKYDVDVFVMGDDWKGKFDFLKDYCEVVYLPRTEGISTTQLKEELKQ